MRTWLFIFNYYLNITVGFLFFRPPSRGLEPVFKKKKKNNDSIYYTRTARRIKKRVYKSFDYTS